MRGHVLVKRHPARAYAVEMVSVGRADTSLAATRRGAHLSNVGRRPTCDSVQIFFGIRLTGGDLYWTLPMSELEAQGRLETQKRLLPPPPEGFAGRAR